MTGNITTKERTCLEDQLDCERTRVAYADLCPDVALKGKMTEMADIYQKHFDILMGFLN